MSTREERWLGFDRSVERMFPTITGEHWRESLRRERAGVANPVAAGIRKKILSRPTGKSESGNVSKTST